MIYCRKSTDDKENQAKSLPEQVELCKKYVEDHGLKLINGAEEERIIQEPESARESGIREKFTKMLTDIRAGKIDGIVSYHPDRLSRNMKETGEIIDLLNKGIIKNLHFCTVAFENNPTGKTLLGMLFVMAKQYTDHLKEQVLWGLDYHVSKSGEKLNRANHGYFKDANGFLRPDYRNWALIKDAWYMRLDGKREEEIAKFLSDRKYRVALGRGGNKHKLCVFTKQMVSTLLKNPVYAGVLRYGDRVVVLSDHYDFQPMITPEQFLRVRGGKVDGVFVARRNGDVKADLLRQKVICRYCGEKMWAGISHHSRQDKYRFYYRCDTEGCEFENKSVRAHVVVNFAIELLGKVTVKLNEAYQVYRDQWQETIKYKMKNLESERKELLVEKRNKNSKIEEIKRYILKYEGDKKNKKLIDSYKGDLNWALERKEKIESRLGQIKHEVEASNKVPKTAGEFHELVKRLPGLVENATSIKQLDFILGKVFTNLTVKGNKVANYTLNPMFEQVFELPKVISSESKRTRTSDLFNVNEAL